MNDVAVERHRAERTLRTRFTNVCLLRLLERVSVRFARAGVPLMVLKGAALNLTAYERPDERPMADLDLLVRVPDAERAVKLLRAEGCRPGRGLLRADFFPRFYYETELVSERVWPLRIDLHARPFRPLRYARRVPAEAFWADAVEVRVGAGRVLMPSVEDMLIHLAVHSAVHGNRERRWLADLPRWVAHAGAGLDWERLLEHVEAWELALPVREALARAEQELGPMVPLDIRRRLAALPVGRRARWALRQAPHDADHPVRQVLMNVVCTPGWRFVLGYLRAVLLPDRRHMATWYGRQHRGWLPLAHLLRWLSPLWRRFEPLWRRLGKFEARDDGPRGAGVFATRNLRAGARLAKGARRLAESDHAPVPASLRLVRHCCRPNVGRCGREWRALRDIRAGQGLTIDHGVGACECRRDAQEAPVA